MSSRTVQFMVILRTQAIYVFLFIYGLFYIVIVKVIHAGYLFKKKRSLVPGQQWTKR